MLKRLQKKVRHFFKALSPAPSSGCKTRSQKMIEKMANANTGTEPVSRPKDLSDLPSGLYKNEQGDCIYFEGVVPYKDEMLALYREMYQYEWRLQEVEEFVDKFFGSGSVTKVTPITIHKRW